MGCVYLIWQEGTDLYKIGMTNGEPKDRLSQLQSGNPSKLELICVMKSESPMSKEQELHKRWQEYRVQGEWFKIHPTLINELLSSFEHQLQDPVFTQVGYQVGMQITKQFHEGAKKAINSTLLCLLQAINEDDSVFERPELNQILDAVVFENAARKVICSLYEEIESRKAAAQSATQSLKESA
jgi:hypothetical protein